MFFDIGSTLVDESQAYDERARSMLDGTGIPFEHFNEKRLYFSRLGDDGDGKAARFFNLEKTPWPGNLERLFPDSEDILRYLKEKGFKLGIIANQAPGAGKRLEAFGILEYFDTPVFSCDCGIRKPDERIFKLALDKAGCTAEDAVMVGDRLDNDIIPAKRIGMSTIWMKRGFSQYQDESLAMGLADFTVRDMEGLKTIL